MDRVEARIGLGGGDRWIVGDCDRAARMGAAMITVWFFMAILYGKSVTQAGPFVSLEQCEAARTAWAKSDDAFYMLKSSTCYKGVIK